MKPTFLVPGTLCDSRVFGELANHLFAPTVADYSGFSSAGDAALALLPSVQRGSLGISFSLGGWILLEMARLDPDRFEAILLISGNAHPDAPENADARWARVARARDNGFQYVFAEEWRDALAPGHLDDDAIRQTIVAMADAIGHEGHACHTGINITRPDHRVLAQNPPVPLHVIAGAQDRLCPKDRYEVAAAGPQSRLTLVENAGHYLPLEEPAAVRAYVQAHFPEHLP